MNICVYLAHAMAPFFLAVSTQYRFAHTDLKVPDFSFYRKDAKDAGDSQTSDNARKAFTYLMVAGKSPISVFSARIIALRVHLLTLYS